MKRIKRLGVMLVAAMTVGAASAQSVEDVKQKWQEAAELLQSKKLVEAIPVLEEVVKLGAAAGPEATEVVSEAQKYLPTCYQQKGAELYKAQKFDEAIAAVTRAADLADMQGDMMMARKMGRMVSQLYMAQGVGSFNAKNYAKALESFQKGYEQDPDNVQLTYFMAKSYAELKELDKAVELYKQVIDKGTENSKFAQQAAAAKADMENSLLVAISDAAKAGDIEKVQTFVALIPESANANLLLIQTANNFKKYDVVIAKGADAYAVQTDEAQKSNVAYLIGVAYQNRGNNAKAAEWLRKVTAGPNVAAAKALLADVTAA